MTITDSLDITDTTTYTVNSSSNLAVPFAGSPTIVGSALSITNDSLGNPTQFNLSEDFLYRVTVTVAVTGASTAVQAGLITPTATIQISDLRAGAFTALVDGIGPMYLACNRSQTSSYNTRSMSIVAIPREVTGAVVCRNQRTSSSPTFTSTKTRILSTRGLVKAGRMYLIVANGEVTVDANAAATSQHELRITIDDTEPTTSSTVVGRTVTYHNPTNGCPTDVKIVGAYIPSADVCLRVAVVSSRPLGTPTCQWVPSSDYPMALEIIDVGPGRTASGTVY